jgi:hypothetical protein
MDISVNWSSTDGVPDLNSMSPRAKLMPGWRGSPQRIMVIAGRRAQAKLLVVPQMTTPALGWMLLRAAAAVPIPGAGQNSQEFQTAESVVPAAQAESASWATRTVDPQAAAGQTARGLHKRDLSADG